MINPSLVISLFLISTQPARSTSCPTCPKLYPSIEELLLAEQKKEEKAFGLQKTQDKIQGKLVDYSPEKSRHRNIIIHPKVNSSGLEAESSPHVRSYTPKRDRILEVINAPSRRPETRHINSLEGPANQDLRGTFDRNMAFSTQLQNRKR